jgi:peroxiredoxin
VLAAFLLLLVGGASSVSPEEDIAARVAVAIREAEGFGGTSFHLTEPIAALGTPAIPALAALLADTKVPDSRRVLAACALGRIRAPEALQALRGALARGEPSKEVRAAVEESCFLRGDTEAVDARIALLATKHRDLPVAALGARLHVAQTYAATGRFKIAASLMKELVRSEREARPEMARTGAYNWACYAALAGDRKEALEAVRIAVASDRTDLDWMAKDLDLALIHGDEEFVRLLAEARQRRDAKGPRRVDLQHEPGYAEYREIHRAYWDAQEAWIEANNGYWDDYQPWLERSGKSQGPEAAEAYKKEKGPFEAREPTEEWLPRFLSFFEKHRGTAVGREARTSILTIYGNERNLTALLDLYLAALAEDPDLSALARHADHALYAASPDRLGVVRAALSKAVAAHPSDPHAADLLLALAKNLGRSEDAGAARTAYADIAKRFPGTDAAKEAEGALYELDKLGVGARAPDFSAPDIRGQPCSLSSLRGKVVLLDFWATWCGPCLGEIPALKALFKQHAGEAGQDLVMIGISLDEDGWELAEFLERERILWSQLCDLGGFDTSLARLYHVRGIPRAVLIDRQGQIAAKDLRGEKLADAVRKLLQAPK